MIATAALGGGSVLLLVIYLVTRRRSSTNPPTVRSWTADAAATAARLAKADRNRARREPPSALDRAVRVLVRSAP